MKPKKCKQCLQKFTPMRGFQDTCSVPCAIEFAKANPDKGLRTNRAVEGIARRFRSKQKREGLERIMTRSDWLKRCQIAFNAMINRRDIGLPCIACDKPIQTVVHASHYRSVGSNPSTRYDERNCHSGCAKCNVYSGGNLINYRINLIRKIGLAEVEALEADQSVKKWSIAQIKEMAGFFASRYKLRDFQTDVVIK